jgi:hypothetical protein
VGQNDGTEMNNEVITMWTNDGFTQRIFLLDDINEDDIKMSHDRYDVYVNGEFVGHKTLLTQSEDITDVNDFLQAQGYQQFQANIEGDHYELQVEDEGISSEMKEALQIYLQNR